jgi:hypothetical protein
LSRRIFDRMLTSRRPLRQKRYSVGMNARIADAGTKYLAISTVCALFERAPPLVSRQRVSDSQSSRPDFWIRQKGFATSRFNMMRIMARRMKATTALV